MLAAYVPNGHSLERRDIVSGEEVPDNAVWLDLVNPAPGEDKLIERLLGIAVPTREEMQEIEVSSRLYVENHARYMTATLMCNSDTATPKTTAVTFILSGHRLVTVRYDQPKPFALVESVRHGLENGAPCAPGSPFVSKPCSGRPPEISGAAALTAVPVVVKVGCHHW